MSSHGPWEQRGASERSSGEMSRGLAIILPPLPLFVRKSFHSQVQSPGPPNGKEGGTFQAIDPGEEQVKMGISVGVRRLGGNESEECRRV